MTEPKTTAELACEIWDNAQPITDTLVETYLTSRGITPPSTAPECLRFAPQLRHPNKRYFPAMVALPTEPKTGTPVGGIQRTFLSWSGNGKAQVDKSEQKLSLGPCKGGVIRLAEPIDGEPLLIGEGVETVLTVMEATGLPGWATLGTSGLVNLELPDNVSQVILLAENDGGPNEKAFGEVLPELIARGVKALVGRPPPGLKDFNDLVNGKSGHLPAAGRIVVKEAIEVGAKSEAEVEAESEAENNLEDEDGRFRLAETGLWWRKDDHGKWKWIAQPFKIVGWARDAADARGQSADWGKLIRFNNCDGAEHEIVVSLASLHGDAGALISSLAHWGMNIKCTPIARRLFAEYLASVDVEERVTVVHRNGWVRIGGARAFALPNNMIASAGEEPVILAKDAVGPYDQAGTLEDWKTGVGALASDHRFLRFSIATALAGTLLYIGGFESGCFHLYEKSSEGKTTCLRAAASVWGSGSDGGYVRTWRSTANGLEAALAGANDTFLPLDEVGQADGRELGQALYMATGGVGKQRMRRDATLRPSHVWRVQVLSSGEHPIQTKLSEDVKRGARAYAGHLVRAIDIRARRTHGVFDAFEPGDVDPKAFADKCKSAASTHYGTAGPEFVRRLIVRDISAKNVRERVEAFVQDALMDIKDYHGQAARVAERFGLISAAGEYGVQFGILPWEQSCCFNDAKELFNAWLERRGGAAPYEARQAVAQVRHFIEAHGDSRFEKLVSVKDAESRTVADLRDPDARFPLNRAGYRRGEGAEERWLIFPEVWTNEVCVGLDASQVASILASLGMLEPDGEGNPSKSVKISGKARRFYVLTPLIFEGWRDAPEDMEAVTVTPVTP